MTRGKSAVNREEDGVNLERREVDLCATTIEKKLRSGGSQMEWAVMVDLHRTGAASQKASKSLMGPD